jgi:hypothetical protein
MAKNNLKFVWNNFSQPVQAFAQTLTPFLGSITNKLAADTKEVVLTNNAGDATLTFSSGDAVIQTSGSGSDLFIRTLTGDDIILESGDDIRLEGDKGLYDDEVEGGDINLYAGDGSDGDAGSAGSGGDIRIEAGDAGVSTSGDQGYGGFVTIQGGYTTETESAGGDISLIPGGSTDGISGYVYIGNNFQWSFDTNKGVLYFPVVPLANLPLPGIVVGARAMINDSNVVALENFGAIAATGGSNIVPVFSNGTNWLIG